jgi:hypothetical protein
MEAPVNQPTASTIPLLSPKLGAMAPRMLSAVTLGRETSLDLDLDLDLLRGMLRRLEDVTPAGQHYLMAKMIPLLRREALAPNKTFRPSDLDVVNRSLEDLEHEASRMAPDLAAFSQKARILVDVLALA